jgi:polar amino acid transport system substrate-binding protein
MCKFAARCWAWSMVLLLTLGSASAQAEVKKSDVLERIRQSGQVRIGIKTDVAPFGFLNPAGEAVGFEIDMAADIANRLGVTLVTRSVTTQDRFQKLELDEVDILVATVGDSLERRKVATAIEPAYFQGGVTIMLRPDRQLKDWNAIRGKAICALQGAYFNRPISERYILSLQTYKTVRDALLALKDGQCDGFLYNRPAIQGYLKSADFTDYTARLPDVLISPWAIFIEKAEAGSELERFLGDMVADWYRNGFIAHSAEKWGVRYGASWPDGELALWNRKDAKGQYVCTREPNGNWPSECRKMELIKADDVTGLQALGLRLKEAMNIDLSYVYDPYDRYQIFRGLLLTFGLTLASIVATLVLGVFAALAVDARLPVLSKAISVVMAAFRFNPPILMMYLLFFGIGGILLAEYGIKVPAFGVAVCCVAIYTAGIVVSALGDSADHIRKTDPSFRLSLATVGQTIEYSRWPIKQALINATKMSMISSAIAVPELLSATSLVMADKGNLVVMMVTLVGVYYAVSAFWIGAFNMLENWIYRKPVKAGQGYDE